MRPEVRSAAKDSKRSLANSMRLDRRAMLKASAAAASAGLLNVKASGEEAAAVEGIVDTLVFLDEFPFRRVTGGGAGELAGKLRKTGVSQAWAGTFDGLLHKDIGGANQRLAEACRRDGEGLLLPFGTINLVLPDWQEDVRRCHEVHGMRGVRLHPNYHGYSLSDPRLEKLLEACGHHGLVVQIVLWMDDERHAYLRLPQAPPELKPLSSLVARFPELKVIVYGNSPFADAALAAELVKLPNMSFGFCSGEQPESRLRIRPLADRLVAASWAPLHEIGGGFTLNDGILDFGF